MSNSSVELNLDNIRIDGGTQPREELNNDTVVEYTDSLKSGATLPPMLVVFDGSHYWLYGGFHRWHAHRKAGNKTVSVIVTEGNLEDARWLALAENQTHGIRRTNGDKRAAAEMALKHFSGFSDRSLAEQCGVSHTFVAEIRAAQVATDATCGRNGDECTPRSDEEEDSDSAEQETPAEPETRTGRDGKQHPAKKANPLWCSRCQRMGVQAVDCPACKTVREAAEKKKKASKRKPAPAREELKDRVGNVLPDSCRDAFDDDGLPNLIAELESVAESFRCDPWLDKAQKLTPHFAFLLITKFKEHSYSALESLQLAIEALKAGSPYAVCPKCAGAKENGSVCRGCRGNGFVPETRFAELSK